MIKHLDLSQQRRLLETLLRVVHEQETEIKPHCVMELEGLGIEIWHGINAQMYVEKERLS